MTIKNKTFENTENHKTSNGVRILLFTQALDTTDPVLSVYHDWVAEFAKKFESIVVITLKKGVYNLPANVKVLSLGKEDGESRVKYVKNFYSYIFSEKNNYNSVFVHMNQEYILLGGLVWKLFGKPVYMWRNHHAGSFVTDIASVFCKKVFCTSKYSYTAKYKKTVLMPVGIDTEKFKIQNSKFKIPNSVLFLARIAPSKRPHVLLEALKILKDKGVDFTSSIYGDSLPKDRAYHDSLVEYVNTNNLKLSVSFYPGVPNIETVGLYNKHEVSVNTSSSGMYDKTIFEAMSCGALMLASNENLRGLIDERFLFMENNADDLAKKLEIALSLDIKEKEELGSVLRNLVVEKHSLNTLGLKLVSTMSNK